MLQNNTAVTIKENQAENIIVHAKVVLYRLKMFPFAVYQKKHRGGEQGTTTSCTVHNYFTLQVALHFQAIAVWPSCECSQCPNVEVMSAYFSRIS